MAKYGMLNRPEVFDFKINAITVDQTEERKVDCYMHILDNAGEKLDGSSMVIAGTTEEVQGIPLLSWTHDFWQPAQIERTKSEGVSVSSSIHGDLTVIKKIDATTPHLLKSCWSGKPLQEVQLHAYRSTSNNYLNIIISNALITDYTILDAPGYDDSMEKIKFNYLAVEYTYNPTGLLDALDGNIPVSYDRTTKVVA